MDFANSNQFEKMRRLEGCGDSDQVWDLSEIYDKIKDEIEAKNFNVEEKIEDYNINPETRRCLDGARLFCIDASEEFKQTFLSLLDSYNNNHRKISQKITDFLLDHKFDLPKFTIAHRGSAQKLLEDFGFNFEINDKNLLLVFQLP